MAVQHTPDTGMAPSPSSVPSGGNLPTVGWERGHKRVKSYTVNVRDGILVLTRASTSIMVGVVCSVYHRSRYN